MAAGLADTYALGVTSEAIGAGIPVVMVPFVSPGLAARLPYRAAVETLRTEGVVFVDGDDDGGDDPPSRFARALATLTALVDGR